MAQMEGAEDAQRAIQANTSPRYKRLENLERWVDCTQYEGQPDWFTGGPQEAPLWERAPVIVYPTVQVAIRSNVDLVFGEGRFPEFTARPGENEDGEDNGIGEDDSEAVDRFLREYHKLCRFGSHCRDAFTAAQSCGTAVGIHGHRNGVPFAELIPAKWCNPTFGIDREVTAVEIRYPYLEEIKVNGKWRVVAKLYKRIVDQKRDTTFVPVDARTDGEEPAWTVDKKRDIAHNLGFCPIVWYPFMRGCAPVNVIDGKAIHTLLLDEIRGHDIALSQKHRCTLLAEPQPFETGVQPGFNPTDSGRMAILPATQYGGDPARGDFTGERRGGYMVGEEQSARKKGPGWMWSYPNELTKVDYLTFPPGILKEMADHCLDLLHKIEDGLCVVLPKPAEFKFAGAVSGKSLQMVRQRQYDRCDQYRDDLWNGFLLPTIDIQLRIAERAGSQLRVPGSEKIAGIIGALFEKSTDASTAAA